MQKFPYSSHYHAVLINHYFFICARLELFCDFLQYDWLHERAAFYDILAPGQELFYDKKSRNEAKFQD